MKEVGNNESKISAGIHFSLGNYALVEGAIAAGCNFFAGYPITPANEISELMSKRLPQVSGKFLQGEDELCSIYACASASIAGAKAMTATASAGFNYMQEGLGYGYAVEIPMVIADVQRCRGENFASQADVMQMRYGASGDYEAIVVCPSSVQELFDYTIWAFNLAEKYRNPVIIMSETTIALMRERLVIPPEQEINLENRKYTNLAPQDYFPFRAKNNSIPEFAPIGEGYNVVYSLNPHDERGNIDWNPIEFDRLYKRVIGKIRDNRKNICKTEVFEMDDANYALIAYGSEVRPAIEAAKLARDEGIKVGVLKLCNVWPVPEEQILEISKAVKMIFSVEMNMGKYATEIERIAQCNCRTNRITKNQGLVHLPEEILSSIKEGIK